MHIFVYFIDHSHSFLAGYYHKMLWEWVFQSIWNSNKIPTTPTVILWSCKCWHSEARRPLRVIWWRWWRLIVREMTFFVSFDTARLHLSLPLLSFSNTCDVNSCNFFAYLPTRPQFLLHHFRPNCSGHRIDDNKVALEHEELPCSVKIVEWISMLGINSFSIFWFPFSC